MDDDVFLFIPLMNYMLISIYSLYLLENAEVKNFTFLIKCKAIPFHENGSFVHSFCRASFILLKNSYVHYVTYVKFKLRT